MDIWTDKAFEISSSKQGYANRLQLSDFFKQARKHRTNILAAKKSLIYVHKLFIDEDIIWPEQCDRAISCILTMRESVQLFSRFLDEITYLPADKAAHFYELLIGVHRIDEEISKLVALLVSYRPICKSSSKQAINQRQKIFSRLEAFMESSDDILDRITFLLDEAHFPKSGYLQHSSE